MGLRNAPTPDQSDAKTIIRAPYPTVPLRRQQRESGGGHARRLQKLSS